ncbi:phosphatidate phosphatase LPIN3 isoform X2 [Neocloeon triangulifer]|uniref:phosphatidate phosphatase LPIN3 isoform X2 n=1 Tax=Neocloeon triangulifer TaxID=2078957 RepID=UPI00286F97E2|nr:phosphatidate phosphatase LPIN3 isoform X2 [Neocloeon triangulifer]
MNYIGKVLSNVREFYNDINTATLTGAIDVVVVEHPDGTFTCSPFHVRFGKMGVLRSREKVVDIEVNGEPLDIHMKLGESGEAFFVEELSSSELESFPSYLACSPIPLEGEQLMIENFHNKSPKPISPLAITLPPSAELKDRSPERKSLIPPLSPLHEAHEAAGGNAASSGPKTFHAEKVGDENSKAGTAEFRPIHKLGESASQEEEQTANEPSNGQSNGGSKNSRRKRRRKSLLKKKQQQNMTSTASNQDEGEVDGSQLNHSTLAPTSAAEQAEDTQFELEDVNLPTESEPTVCTQHLGGVMLSGYGNSAEVTYSLECSKCAETCSKLADSSLSTDIADEKRKPADLHFFSDTEATPCCSFTPADLAALQGLNLICQPFWSAHIGQTSPQINHGSRAGSPTPQSDSELELRRQSSATEPTQLEAELQAELGVGGKQSWKWGELPSPPLQPPRMQFDGSSESQESSPVEEQGTALDKENQRRSSMLSGVWSLMKNQSRRASQQQQADGMYLEQFDVNMDPEVAALYFPASYRPAGSDDVSLPSRPSLTEATVKEEDTESGKGPSIPQSPHSVEGAIGEPKFLDSDLEDGKSSDKLFTDLALSLCGPLDLSNPPSEEVFSKAIVSHEEFKQNPALLENPALVVRLNNKLQTWREAAPEVMSLLLFQQPLVPKKEQTPDIPEMLGPLSVGDQAETSPIESNSQSTADPIVEETPRYSWFSWRRSGSVSKKSDISPQLHDVAAGRLPSYRSSDEEELNEIAAKSALKEDTITKEGEGYSGSNSSDESDGASSANRIAIPGARLRLDKENKVYRKTLRLSSDQIASLQLNEGANEVVFSVTTAYQGTTRCKCHVYRWRWDDKIVISDIDGTITKSDVLGHILPVLGKDWAQSGVAQLFTKIKNNGYRLLYLSARAIGQARTTRDYLKSIKQGDLSLPEGPLLLNPTSLISALHREVIEKKPEEFKISCLRDVQALFPYDCKPFYAGYGNKINDVWAYRAVGIPIFRIFTINHRGELKHELTQTFQTSYSNMSYIVDQMFPPPAESKSATEDFNSFNFWRDPIPELDPSMIPETPVSPKGSKTPVKESKSVLTK